MLAAEKLAAVTGIFPKSGHPSDADVLASDGVTAKWLARLKRWLAAGSAEDYQPTEFDVPEPPEAEKLQDKLLTPIEGEEEARILGAFDDPLASQEYLDLIKRARAYVDAKWPKVEVPGAIDEVFPPSEEELYDLWAIVRVLDDPEVILEEVEMQSVSIPMIEAWRSIYPEWSAEILAGLDQLMIERRAAKKFMPWQQLELWRMLTGRDLQAPVEVVEAKKPEDKQAGQVATPRTKRIGEE